MHLRSLRNRRTTIAIMITTMMVMMMMLMIMMTMLAQFMHTLLLQEIIEEHDIKLDWFFKASLIHDIVNVSVAVCNYLLFVLRFHRVQHQL